MGAVMTNQPTKGPLNRVDFDNVVHVLGGGNLTIFDGPDRKANAALFIRAQHMDELVEAVEQFLAPINQTNQVAISEAEQDRDRVFYPRALAILAKIKGEK